MPSDDIAISVRHLTKTYRLFAHPGDRVKQFLSLGLKQYHREFTALQDVSFDIRKGETVGIIGKNGSGKSTLLQLICGILKPTAGTVQVNGRISALLELGAGFNPEFTGRENVHFQGALMGFTQAQMAERFDEIAAFADIGEFIDQPVRTYSSGMFVRLAFAVAINVDADILVIDESLSVGDSFFQHKSLGRIRRLCDAGTTVLFVSHALPVVKSLCGKALYLADGAVIGYGPTKPVCDAYLNASTRTAAQTLAAGEAGPPPAILPATPCDGLFRADPGFPTRLGQRSGSGAVRIVSVETLDDDGRARRAFDTTPRITFRIHFQADRPIAAGAALGILISDRSGRDLCALNSNYYGTALPALAAGHGYLYDLTARLPFGAGSYAVHVGIKPDPAGDLYYDRCFDSAVFEILDNPEGMQGYGLPVVIRPDKVSLYQERLGEGPGVRLQ